MSELEIIQLCIISAIVLFLVIFYAIKAIKNKWVGKLVSSVKEACKVAEASGKTGSEKKEMVLKAVETKCGELGIPFKLIHTLICKLIEQIINGYNAIVK